MNRLRLIKTAYTALAALMLAACAGDELTDGTVQDLPEGKYPLQISSVTMSAESTAQPWGANAPQTRVSESTDGNSSEWNEGDEITVQLSGTMADNSSYTVEGKYTIGSDKTSLTPVSGKELYWHSTSVGTVTAWYSNPAAASDNTVNLSDQNQNNGLAYVLFSTPQTVQYSATNTQLAFNHKLAKIRVKFKGGTYGIDKVEVYAHTSCKINSDGTLTDFGSVGYIPMCKNTYSDGTYWEANVVPGYEINKVRLNDNKECKITNPVTPAEAAKYYTMEISVTGGAYYPDELPEITDNGEYTISGSGSKNITISSGTPTVTLADVTLTNAIINITGGSPILIIKRTNTIQGNDGSTDNFGGINLSNNANVTIKGKNADNIDENVLNITNGNIGSSADYAKCGNIKIEGIKAKITSASMVVGIGSGWQGVCGNITINNSKINVNGNNGSAAIGSGYQKSECGNIEITNSDITASGSNYMDDNSAAIGCGGTADNYMCICRNITITLKDGQTKEEFEANLTASNYAEKVGSGGRDNGTNTANLNGKVGTITWKRADGTVIETIAARN